MAAYSTGTAKITAGMTKVYGTGTSWAVFLAAGDLFKIQGDNVFYEIGSVETATELTLTSRYVNSNFQNAVATNVASVNTATKMYSGSLIRTPVILNSIRFVASTEEVFTDNGLGILAGNASPAGSGTIDYDSGAWAITFGTSLTATVNLAASFNQGTLNQGLSYQAVVDFTPFYGIPEISTNDVNFAHIYTKAMRIIDKQISLASLHTTASVITASHFHGTKSATMNNMSIINASITNASIQKLKVTNASINNASINTLKVQNFIGSVTTLDNIAVLNNATIVEASIQKLKVISASIREASINNLMVQKIKGTNASFVEASIQKLKALNASITNATIGVLTVNPGELNVTQGIVRFGVTHSIQGALSLYGRSDGAGGKMILWGGDTADAFIDRYIYAMVENVASPSYSNLHIGPDTDADSFKYDGFLGKWEFTGAGGVAITAGITAANASFVQASIQTLKILNNMTRFHAVNASFAGASINKLKALNASIANASINNLKVDSLVYNKESVINATITNATIQHLTVHASRLNTDQTWDGYSLSATMAATVAFGEVLYTDSSFDYGLANCATTGTLPVSAMAVSAGAGKQKIILRGQICATVWNWSAGLIYCAATDGALTQLIAAGSGKIVQIMGHAISADTMFFNPNKGTVKIA